MFDVKLFSIINGFAGHSAWLDQIGRYTAVYGLLLVLLLALTVAWWPRLAPEHRRGYAAGLLLVAAGCLLLAGVEWGLTTHLLHHDLRTRPFSAHWATLLITAGSAMSFPAWPVAIAFALAPGTLRVMPRMGWVMIALSALLALSLVFVGINYPVDVCIGGVLGIAIGETGALLALPTRRAHPWRTLLILWVALILGTGVIAARLYQHSDERETKSETLTASAVLVTPPAPLLRQLTPVVLPGISSIQAASNGHLLAAEVHVMLPGGGASLTDIEDVARRVTNTTFTGWSSLDLLTVTITDVVQHGTVRRNRTLYTATIDRKDWPQSGFSPAAKLPGKKFFNTELLAK